MLLPVYLGLLSHGEGALAESWRHVAAAHGAEPDVASLCRTLAGQCDSHVAALAPVVARYGDQPDDEPDRLHVEAVADTRDGPLGLLRDLQDLQDLHQHASLVDVTWTLVEQAGQALRDTELLEVIDSCHAENRTQLAWLITRMKAAAPQALLVA